MSKSSVNIVFVVATAGCLAGCAYPPGPGYQAYGYIPTGYPASASAAAQPAAPYNYAPPVAGAPANTGQVPAYPDASYYQPGYPPPYADNYAGYSSDGSYDDLLFGAGDFGIGGYGGLYGGGFYGGYGYGHGYGRGGGWGGYGRGGGFHGGAGGSHSAGGFHGGGGGGGGGHGGGGHGR